MAGSKAVDHYLHNVLIMSSSGVRIGAFEWLNVSHIRPVIRIKDNYVVLGLDGSSASEMIRTQDEGREIVCGVMRVYAGEGNDEYETLISNEAYRAFRSYVEIRMREGERVTGDSPLIVTRDMSRRCSPGTIVHWREGKPRHN